MKISLIIPAYNEDRRIRSTLGDYYNGFTAKFEDFEIIVEMDECTDKTTEIVSEISKSWKINIKNGGYWR